MLLGQPSAIEDYMQSLLGPPPGMANAGGNAPMPQGPINAALSSQMSQMQAPPMASPKTSMVDRLHERLSGLLGSVKSSAPAGYGGLLSEEEQQSAQPGVGTSILGRVLGLGSDVFTKQAYGRNLDHMLELKKIASGMADQRDKKAQEAKHAATREQVGAVLGDTTMTPDARFAALTKLLGVAYANGDMQSMGAISSAMQTAKPTAGAAPKAPTWEDFGGYKALVGPDGKEIQRVNKTPSPKDPNAPDTASQLRDQRMFAREQQLADDYNKDTKDSREMAVKVSGALSEAPAAKSGDGIAQVNLLYAFVSSMDPGTAVREGEIGLVRSSGSLIQQAQGLLAKYGQGQAVTVPPAMIDQMSNLMQRRLDGSAKYVKSRSGYYKTRAKQWGVNESAFPELELPQAPPVTSKGSGSVAGGPPPYDPNKKY